MDPMDNKPGDQPTEEIKQSTGHTTHDVRSEADEALRRFNMEQAQRAGQRENVPYLEGRVTLKLTVEGTALPLIFTVENEVIIGRRDPTMSGGPEIDLTPFGAYQMGISRRHAAFRLHNGRLELTDLGSRNGTVLNGRRLTAHQPEPVIDGDDLRMGKIAARVAILREDEADS
ncbi:MAG: FHA domain-containing protein [Chloroflexota bacterium]